MIITVEKLRQHIDSEISDEMLLGRISAVESFIRKYTNNNFQVREIRSQSAVMNEKIVNPPQYISIGDTIQISDSLLNNGLYVVESVNDDGIIVSEKLIDCGKNIVTKVYYPPDVIMGAVNMIKWDLENRQKVRIQSEKISRHSVTYFSDEKNINMGYPKYVLGFLKPYMKGRF